MITGCQASHNCPKSFLTRAKRDDGVRGVVERNTMRYYLAVGFNTRAPSGYSNTGLPLILSVCNRARPEIFGRAVGGIDSRAIIAL